MTAFVNYNFSAPVVENRLLGVIKTENMPNGLKEDFTADLQKMVGVGSDDRPSTEIPFNSPSE